MFQGTFTAIVTPFNTDGSVDYAKLRDLIDIQAEAGINGIVPVGTTGESPTVNVDEHSKIIDVRISVRIKLGFTDNFFINSVQNARTFYTQYIRRCNSLGQPE